MKEKRCEYGRRHHCEKEGHESLVSDPDDGVGYAVEQSRSNRLFSVIEDKALIDRAALRPFVERALPEGVAAGDDRDHGEIVRGRR